MKNKLLVICCAMLSLAVNVYAGRYNGAHRNGPSAKTTLLDPGEGNYDMKHLKFNLHVTDTSVYIWGDVSTTAQVIAASMSNYIFELDTLMVIDSAKVNGALLPVSTAGFVRTITLPSALSSGALFTAQIFYHGVPPPSTPATFFNGVTHDVSAGGTQMVYTISDPWVALDWWPCKQSVDDKIDSVDMYVTVPRNVVDGSNGILVNVDTTTTPGFWKYHWQTHYPIAYYLISIAVARYSEYKSYLHFTGSTDSMLIQNFFIDTATFNPLYKANFDSLGQIIDYYSSLFGRYPFWQEKYGVCYTTLPGGMEHQTMTTIGVPNTYIIAHELMHQWFGDHVSYATWGDVWLSEGFATFSEQLFLTHFWGAAAGLAHRQDYLNNIHYGILTDPCGETFVTDTTTAAALFYTPTVYAKGQGIITMLRYLAPTDNQFFQVLQTYQQTYGMGNASTANLVAIVDSVYGFSLDSFFNQWIYGQGYPKYAITWDQMGSTVIVKLVQTRSCASYTNHFNTPVELQFISVTGDTTVQAYNTSDVQIFTYNWPYAMDSLALNPDVLTICKQNGVIHQDTSLASALRTSTLLLHNIKVYPNPSENNWQADQLPENIDLTLTDINGKIVWQGKSSKGITTIPGEKLPAGDYYLTAGDNKTDSIKLVRW